MPARRPVAFALAVFGSLALTSCAREEPKEDPRAAPMAIDAQNHAWMRAIKKGDIPTAAAFYTDSATLMAPSTDLVYGRSSIQAFFKSARELGLTEMRLATLNILSGPRMARETGRYTATFQPPKGAASFSDRGKYLRVWIKQIDGTWKLESEIWNAGGAGAPDGGAPSVSTDTVKKN